MSGRGNLPEGPVDYRGEGTGTATGGELGGTIVAVLAGKFVYESNRRHNSIAAFPFNLDYGIRLTVSDGDDVTLE